MAEGKSTVIQGELIVARNIFSDKKSYNLLIFVLEQTTKYHINVRYRGDNEQEKDYYDNFYSQFLEKSTNCHHQIKLIIRGCLEENKLEYEGTGLIKVLSSTK